MERMWYKNIGQLGKMQKQMIQELKNIEED